MSSSSSKYVPVSPEQFDNLEEMVTRYPELAEAAHVHEVIGVNKENYLDTEIAFPKMKDKKGLSQVDLALVDEDGTIYFCEIKRENDPRLYSINLPKVIEQMRRYLESIKRPNIIESYETVCANLASIYEKCPCPSAKKRSDKLRRLSQKGHLKVCKKAILLIIGNGDKWKKSEKVRVKAEDIEDGVIIGPHPAEWFTLSNIKKAL